MDGVLNICKPQGPTSHDIVNKIRHAYNQKKVGHAGTLDPLATGVLVVCLGKATRIVECLMGTTKQYRANMVLGRTTDTQDCTGDLISESDASGITAEDVSEAVSAFLGEIMQMPPMMSALKHNGKPLYKIAREGKTVERELRKVTISSIELVSFRQGVYPEAEVLVTCSSGTYIRTLCHDIGQKLGCGANMSMLERRRVGNFDIENAVSLDEIESAKDTGRLNDYVISISDALVDYPAAVIARSDIQNAVHGIAVKPSEIDMKRSLVKIVSEDGFLIGLGNPLTVENETLVKPCKVFAEAE